MAQPLPFSTVKAYAAFKIEATPGTVESSVAAADHYMRIRDIELSSELASYLLPYASGDHTVSGAVMGRASAGINFTIDLQPASAVGAAAKWTKAAMFSGLRQVARFTYSADLSASNSTAGNIIVDGTTTAITPVVFASDHATTMAAVAAEFVSKGGSGTVATVGGANNRTITIYHPSKVIGISSVAVTGGDAVSVAMSNGVIEDGATDTVTATGKFYLVPPSGNALLVTIKGMHGGHDIGYDETGNPVSLRVVDAQGALVSMTDAANIALTGADTTAVPNTLGITLTDGGTDIYVSSFIVSGGHTVNLVDSGQDVTGNFIGYTSERAPRLRINPQVDLLTNNPMWTRWRAGTQTAVAFAGPVVGGQKITVSIPKVQILTASRANRNGYDIWDMESLIVKDVGIPAYEVMFGA
jgi:hypothetical protein